MRDTLRMLVACLLLLGCRLGVLAAQHPPLTGLFREGDWRTVADFRHVTAIAVGDEAAYVGSAGGIQILPLGTEDVATVTAGDGLPSPLVTALAYEQRRGVVWIGTSLGLALYEPFRGQVQQDPALLGPGRITDIRFGPSQPELGGSGGALDPDPDAFVRIEGRWFRIDPFTLRADEVSGREVPSSPPAIDVREIPFAGGESVRGARSGRPESFRVTAAQSIPGGGIVLGTWGGNVFRYEPARLTTDPAPYGLAGPGGGALGWDGQRLWFTNAPARPRGRGEVVRRVPAVSDATAISSSAPDLTDWRYAYPGLESGLPSDRVHDIAAAHGRTLFATDAGLVIHESESAGWRTLPGLVPTVDEVLAVTSASDGLWLGTPRGLHAFAWPGDAPRPSSVLPGPAPLDSLRPAGSWLHDREVRRLAADAREVYAGTDRGLYRLAPAEPGSGEWLLTRVATAGRAVSDIALLEAEVVVATERGVEILSRGGGESQLLGVGEGGLDDPPIALA
nr:hypothetical protein [Gemmatimonadota bacterium]